MKIGKKFGAGIKFDISESELTISSSNFNLTAEGNVTMSGDVSARKGTFRDIAVMGALVPNLSGSGSLNFVETWALFYGVLYRMIENKTNMLDSCLQDGATTILCKRVLLPCTQPIHFYQFSTQGYS